jgi:c-di-GMP-binding flagellar brake protein YcgR
MFQVGEQKRLSFRILVSWPVTLETAKGSVEAETRDISAGGAHVHCNQHLELNEPIQMIINPPDREPLRVAAMIVWSDQNDESDHPRVIGIRFIEISSEDVVFLEQQALEHFKSRLPES